MNESEDTYGFNKPDAEALVQLIETVDSEYVEGKVRSTRTPEFSLEFRTSGQAIQYSTDSGTTWTTIATIDLQVSGNNLQVTIDGGSNWFTWHTGTTCP